jgi:alanyl-tRNA synthetase
MFCLLTRRLQKSKKGSGQMDNFKARKIFLEYFTSKNHKNVPSSSLIPIDDPTLLFVNSGMVQFKKVFLGLETRDYNRATSSQRCMRVSGKHNDLDDVGISPRHNTFFEMLGNFSFGSYFKEDAITYAWEFLTSVIGFSPDRIWPTVYEDDDDAFKLWQDIAKIPPSRITRLGKKTNFWSMGDTGPCGPCSEIIYDRGPEKCTCHRTDCHLRYDDCDRWWELWNLVFMQYNLEKDGTLIPLSTPCVDTGMGYERLLILTNNLNNVYETDLFQPLIAQIRDMTGQDTDQYLRNPFAYRAIADHIRSITFLISDGIMPSNEGRGYVLRLLMRRSIRYGKTLGLPDLFLGRIADVVIDVMGNHYVELTEKRDFIKQAISQEEEKFQKTLYSGLNRVDELISQMKNKGITTLPGETVFQLYDTFGFPYILTRDVARENEMEIDEISFNQALEAQRQRSRMASRFVTDERGMIYRQLKVEPTRFIGYENLMGSGKVVGLISNGTLVEQVGSDEEVEVVLDETPFYAELGGQVGDQGIIESTNGQLDVEDTFTPLPSSVVHRCHVTKGSLSLGESVILRVNKERRFSIARNHTATHLLHKALQEVLGPHATQAGSLVSPERLRFDFVHLIPPTQQQLFGIERIVNEKIRDDLLVKWETKGYQAAVADGATALFGEKYSDQVRVVSILRESENEKNLCYSKELCGGTHVSRTGQIGIFHIISESSIGRGLRRIEAITGFSAEMYAREQFDTLRKVSQLLNVPIDLTLSQITTLLEDMKRQRQEIELLRRQVAKIELKSIASGFQVINGVKVLVSRVQAGDHAILREMSDWAKDEIGTGIIVLGTPINNKPFVVVSITHDLVKQGFDAGQIAKLVGQLMKGSGGGKPAFAQSGGSEGYVLSDTALEQIFNVVETEIKQKEH